MFIEEEVKTLYDKITDEEFAYDSKLRYLKNKINKYGLLYINVSELNYLYAKNGKKIMYDLQLLKNLLHNKGIGYTSIIKKIGIPKATLSKLLNSDRNVKLLQLNILFDRLNKVYALNINKNTIKREV